PNLIRCLRASALALVSTDRAIQSAYLGLNREARQFQQPRGPLSTFPRIPPTAICETAAESCRDLRSPSRESKLGLKSRAPEDLSDTRRLRRYRHAMVLENWQTRGNQRLHARHIPAAHPLHCVRQLCQ